MATDSSILAWEVPWTEETSGLQSMGSQGGGHSLTTKQHVPYTICSVLWIKCKHSSVLLRDSKFTGKNRQA